jgi:hypothetical protein
MNNIKEGIVKDKEVTIDNHKRQKSKEKKKQTGSTLIDVTQIEEFKKSKRNRVLKKSKDNRDLSRIIFKES